MIFERKFKKTCLESSQSLEYKDEKSVCTCEKQSELPTLYCLVEAKYIIKTFIFYKCMG